MILGSLGYIVKHRGGSIKSKKDDWNDVFLVKETESNRGEVYLGKLKLDKKYIGKRVKFKVEFVR